MRIDITPAYGKTVHPYAVEYRFRMQLDTSTACRWTAQPKTMQLFGRLLKNKRFDGGKKAMLYFFKAQISLFLCAFISFLAFIVLKSKEELI